MDIEEKFFVVKSQRLTDESRDDLLYYQMNDRLENMNRRYYVCQTRDGKFWLRVYGVRRKGEIECPSLEAALATCLLMN